MAKGGQSPKERTRAAGVPRGPHHRQNAVTDVRTGPDASTLRRAIIDNLTYVQAVIPSLAILVRSGDPRVLRGHLGSVAGAGAARRRQLSITNP